ncbi:MAG: translation initiation factor IF-1 [Candidatus Berkelbacteria bacterium]|nr:translation initiation factor IF-1 [Candidatus Berkelbacteria bacterium]
MPQGEIIEIEGEVIEALPNALFKIRLKSGQEILGHLSGKMRINYIKVVAGDWVKLEMTPYDLTKGRIVKRLNHNESKSLGQKNMQ